MSAKPATSLPWFESPDYKNTIRAQGSGPGAYVCTMAGYNEHMAQNMAFILTACNDHARLLSRVAELEGAIQHAKGCFEEAQAEGVELNHATVSGIIKRFNAALNTKNTP